MPLAPPLIIIGVVLTTTGLFILVLNLLLKIRVRDFIDHIFSSAIYLTTKYLPIWWAYLKRYVISPPIRVPANTFQREMFGGYDMTNTGNLTGVDLDSGEFRALPDDEPVPVEVAQLVEASPFGPSTDAVILNPDDPFESLLLPIIEKRRQQGNLSPNANLYMNFDRAARETGLTTIDIMNSLVALKNCSIAGMRNSGADDMLPAYLDRAIFAILAYGALLRDFAS